MDKNNNKLKEIEDVICHQYPNIRIWMKAMKLTPMNKMVCHSFVREYVFKNFDIVAFCEEFDRFLKKESNRIKHQPFELYQEFIIKTYIETKNLLIGKPIEKSKLPESVFLYSSAYNFYKYIMKSEGEGARGSRERFNLKKERAFRLMIEDKLTPDDMSHWKGELKGASDIIWFIKHDKIPEEFRKCSNNPEAAQRIRDLFGMAHLSNDGLIEVQIPKNLIENSLRVPTICEAVGYPYFRPAKRIDGFGRGIDLDKKNTGPPEAVHPKISWGENFKIRYVGDLPKERKEFSDSEWREIISKSEADLIAFIKGSKDEA
jgi:hypothetical protein